MNCYTHASDNAKERGFKISKFSVLKPFDNCYLVEYYEEGEELAIEVESHCKWCAIAEVLENER